MTDYYKYLDNLDAGAQILGFLSSEQFLEDTDAEENLALYRAVELLGRELKRNEGLQNRVTDLAEKVHKQRSCCCCGCRHK